MAPSLGPVGEDFAVSGHTGIQEPKLCLLEGRVAWPRSARRLRDTPLSSDSSFPAFPQRPEPQSLVLVAKQNIMDFIARSGCQWAPI